MWWLIGSAPDFWGRGPGFESGISHNERKENKKNGRKRKKDKKSGT